MTDGGAASSSVVDTTTRDGNQSLWGATGLTTPDMLAIAPTIERVGFHALDFTSSTHMAVSVRFHREDPWERIRLMRAALPDTLLNFITTGMRFISWQPCDEEVMRLAFRCVVRNGIRRFQIAEPANDPQRAAARRPRWPARRASRRSSSGSRTRSAPCTRTPTTPSGRPRSPTAPTSTASTSRIPAACSTPDAVRELAPHFVATGGARSSCTATARSGSRRSSTWRGCEAGFHVLHTAVGPAGNGTSQPTADSTLREPRGRGLRAPARPRRARPRRRATSASSPATKGLPPGAPREFDAAYYHHQLPAGWSRRRGGCSRRSAGPSCSTPCSRRSTRVRAEMGYPILVTPVSQLVATQATRNVIDAERWLNVSDETVRYFLGHYGEFAAPPDPAVADRVLSRSRRPRSSATREPRQPRGRPRALRRPDLRRGAAAAADDARGAGRRDAAPRRRSPSGSAAAAAAGRDPLVTLLREARARRAITYLRVRKGDDLVVWRRAS